MKRYIHHIILGAALLLMSAGCARYDEDRLAIGGDRVPLSDLSMDFMVDGADVYTKAGQSVLAENRVTGLYVLLFDAQGNLVHRKSYFVGGGVKPDRYDAQIISYTEKKSEDGGASMGIIPGFFEDYKGNAESLQGQFTFYAVANYNETVEGHLKKVTKESELQDMTVKFVTNGNVFRSNFLMVATEKNVRFSAVDDNGGVTVERIGVTLRLRRVDAKVSFRVTVDIPGARNVAFEDMIYRVHNVPNVTYLIERQKGEGTDASAWDASVANNDYSCMMDETYDTFDSTYTDRVGGEFAFYLRETRLAPKQEITFKDKEDNSSLYALREAWDNENVENVSGKTPVHGGGRTYTYAPEYGTFVEITGNLSYSRINENGQEEHVDGDVTYIIHLGETGNDPDDEEAVNNYDVRRNVRYIYNVNIKGINDMEVEVTEQDELRPGVEGDLVISTNRKVEMDAHYGRVLLTLDKNNLKEAGWSAVTPLGTIEYNPETGQINAPYDYKWVLFAINRHFDPDNDGSSMVKFPGIQAYDGGVKFYENGAQRSEDDIKNDIAVDFGNKFDDGQTFYKSLQTVEGRDNYYAQINDLDEDACLRDINQLIHYLKQELEDPESTIFDGDHVYITAFVDEFTYIYDPRREDYIHPGKSVHDVANDQDAARRLLLWKEYTNVGDRTLNILPMTNISYSPDKNTSITNAYITLSQKSIKTIYDTGETGPADAWGLEVVNETGRLKIPDNITIYGSRTNSKSNGRGNFMNFWVDNSDQSKLDWTGVMTTEQRIENADVLKPGYSDALHACITRNRDLNGNNRIDEDEIYWYLASEAQLSGLFIGQPSLSQDAWLYQGDGSEYSHVVSSTSSDMEDRGSYRILWAEEGASWGYTSGELQSYDHFYDYRCVRNLGIDIADMERSPAHYAIVKQGSDNGEACYTVDVGYLNDRALRSAPDDGINLPLDHERSQNNRPYAKFNVRKEVVYDGPVWLEMRDMLLRNENPCPEGWRVPNQREMLIMMSTLTSEFISEAVDWTGNYGIATTFSFNGTGLYSPQSNTVRNERWGFLTENTNLVLYNPYDPNSGEAGDSNKKLKFRCVKDNTDR